MNNFTIGSLFSGSGGFELGSVINGFKPIWNSEINPFPMLVTAKNFPDTVQLGNISEVKGSEITPVDVITFGSPCFPAGTPVYTSEGYKSIEYIREGDMVLTNKNRFMPVVRIGGNENQSIYELNAQGILPIQATANHPFIVRTKIDNELTEPYEKPLVIISENDYIGVPILNTAENPLDLTPECCFYIGKYLGQKYNLNNDYHSSDCSKIYQGISENAKHLVKNEKIGTEILNLPSDLIKCFVNGYFSGSYSGSSLKTYAKTADYEFAMNLCLAIQKAYKVGCYVCESKLFGPGGYIVSFNLSEDYIPSWKVIDDFIWYPVYGVQKLEYKTDVFNLEVEEDHTYIVQNCLVHNCQDLSQAGKREGLKGSRSCLFHDAIRIIREMRKKTNGKYPKYIVWENVLGSLTSNKGDDFRAVLGEITKIKDETADIPLPQSGKWLGAGEVLGKDYSIAWRTLDAQWWGVPQRRRRIYLVADLDGGSAGQLLFEFESLSGYTPQSCHPASSFGKGFDRSSFGTNRNVTGQGRINRKVSSDIPNYKDSGVPAGKESDKGPDFEGRSNHILDNVASTLRSKAGPPKHASDIKGRLVIGFCGQNSATSGNVSQVNECSPVLSCTKRGCVLSAYGFDAYNSKMSEDVSGTLGVNCGISTGRSTVLCVNDQGGNSLNMEKGETSPTLRAQAHGNHPIVLDRAFYNQGINASFIPKTYSDESSPTLVAQKQPPLVLDDKSICLQGSMIGRKDENGPQGNGLNEEVSFTLNTLDRHAVAKKKTVRRFTPLECGRLQGFPDWWCDSLAIENPTEEQVDYWYNVWENYRLITDAYKKPKTRKQIVDWLQNPTKSDEPQYIMWGNGVALPNVAFVLAAVKWGLEQKEKEKLNAE